MKVIGLIGGCGTGKTEVAAYMKQKHDAYLVIGDEIGHRIIKKGTECFSDIIETFGSGILDQDGEINRKALGAIVFGNEMDLKKLNAITHPRMYREMAQMIEAERARGEHALIVLEAAIMIEARLNELVDELWMIHAQPDIRLNRMMAGRGITNEQAANMMKSQRTEEEYRAFADKIIDNSGDFEKTIQQIQQLLSMQEQSNDK